MKIDRRVLMTGAAALAIVPAATLVLQRLQPARAADRRTAESFGMKALMTTGAIQAGSRSLRVQDAAGFAVGDQVIVESDALPGQKGVGGSWPALIYPDKAAMLADRTQQNGVYAAIAGDGVTAPAGSLHRFDARTGEWAIWNNTEWKEYYWDRAQPFSLVARITGKAGQDLTLDLPAQVGMTKANVYFDNSPLIRPLGVGSSRLNDQELLFGAGVWAFSERIRFESCTSVTLAGMGRDVTTLKSPKCTPSISVEFVGSRSCAVRNLHLLGNCADAGYGTGITPAQSQTVMSRTFTQCIVFRTCRDGGAVSDCKMTNPWTNAVGSAGTNDVWAHRCDVYSAGHRCYIQWMFQFADCSGGGAEDCHLYADYLTGGFESFRGNGVRFTRCGGVNCAFALNSAGSWLIDEPHVVINEGAQKTPPGNHKTTGFFSLHGSIFDINSNISPAAATLSQGGELRNPTLIIKGGMNPKDKTIPNAVVIGPACVNVRITGTHGRDKVSPKGYIEMPNVVDDQESRRGIKSDSAPGSIVDGLRIVGGRTQAWGKVINLINGASVGTIRNCIVDDIAKINAATMTNNITNRDFLAKGKIYDNFLIAAGK